MIEANVKIHKWVKIALSYLVLIAIIGIILRFSFIVNIRPLNFQFLLHTHSHVAMLGWVFTALYVILSYCYLPVKIFLRKSFNVLFWLIQLTIAGMLIAFIIQGYGAFSIAFSSLHIILEYWFIIFFILNVRKNKEIVSKHSLSLLFIYASLFCLFVSSFGPFGLAYINIRGLAHSDLFQQAVYLYLHFQYNGWFLFGLIGIFIWIFEKNNFQLSSKLIKIAFWLLFIPVFPAYFLSLLSYELNSYIVALAVISGIVQFWGALIIFISLLKKPDINKENNLNRFVFFTFLFSFIIKFSLQILSAYPIIRVVAFGSRNVIIGYLHLIMLGVITFGLIYWLIKEELLLMNSNLAKGGLIIFLKGFISGEILLFYESLVFIFKFPILPNYYHIIMLTNVLMLSGIVLFYIKQTGKEKRRIE